MPPASSHDKPQQLNPADPHPANISSFDYRAICLFLACLIYGLFGSPTPQNFGIPEIAIGALLALSIGIGRFRDALLRPASQKKFWKTAGQLFLLYGLSVPLIVAALKGHDINAVIRDILPFLFLFLPMFLLPLLRERPYYFRSFLVALILIGLLFSLRSLVMHFMPDCPIWCTSELLYLENMPTVLFSSLILIGAAIYVLMHGTNIQNTLIFTALTCLSLIPIAAMALTLQRASIGAILIYLIVIQCYYIYKAPARAISTVIIGVIALFLIDISFADIFEGLWAKTQNVGLNMRPQELESVWNIVRQDTISFLFGIGWGGHFNSPAVGGLSVNFTHNFFTSILLKTGLVGVICCIAYIAGLLERLSRVIFKAPVLGLALAAPVLIDLTLYASFKSLDFGLVLLMISGSLVYLRQSESHTLKEPET